MVNNYRVRTALDRIETVLRKNFMRKITSTQLIKRVYCISQVEGK